MSAEREIGTVKVDFATNDTAVVALVGEHDLHSRAALRATLAYAAEGRNMLVDLSRCTLRRLRDHQPPARDAAHAQRRGRTLRARHPP